MRHGRKAAQEYKQDTRDCLYKDLDCSSFSFPVKQSIIPPDTTSFKNNLSKQRFSIIFSYTKRSPFSIKPLLQHTFYHSTYCPRGTWKLYARLRLPSRRIHQDHNPLPHRCRGRHRRPTRSHLRHYPHRSARHIRGPWKLQRPQLLPLRSLPLRLQRAKLRSRSQPQSQHRHLERANQLSHWRRHLHQDRYYSWRAAEGYFAIGVY